MSDWLYKAFQMDKTPLRRATYDYPAIIQCSYVMSLTDSTCTLSGQRCAYRNNGDECCNCTNKIEMDNLRRRKVQISE